MFVDGAPCGDGVLGIYEECDDGGTGGGDGRSAICTVEDALSLFGDAQGGSVTITVDGVDVVVPTSAGQTSAEVVLALAAAINGNATLQSCGTTATASGNRLVTDGAIEATLIGDAGLGLMKQVPALSGAWRLMLAFVLVLAAVFLLRKTG